jgi:tetratricopeptide (TPR) repeat protein
VTALAVVLFLATTTTGSGVPNRIPSRAWGSWLSLAAGALLIGFATWLYAADMAISRGTNAFAHGNIAEAQDELAWGVSQSPWPREGYTYLGMTQIALGRTQAAVHSFERSLVQRPTYEAMLALVEIRIDNQEFAAAASMLAQIRSFRPLPSIHFQAFYFLGLLDMRQGLRTDAQRIWQDLVADDPHNFRALMGLGYLEALDGNSPGARDLYQAARRVILEQLNGGKGTNGMGEANRLRGNLEVVERALASLDQR